MSLENLLPTLSDLGSFSIIIFLLGAGLYYFGRLICDVKVEQQNQTSIYYIQGLLFSVFFIAFPFLFVWLVLGSLNLYPPNIISIVFQLTIFLLLAYCLFINVGRYTLFSRFEDVYKLQLGIKKGDKLVKIAEQRMGHELAPKTLDFYKKYANLITNTVSIFILSLIVIWSTFSTIQTASLIVPESLLIYLFTFLNLTLLQ